MQTDFCPRVENALTQVRLNAYRQNGLGDFDVICRCLWNVALGESLYPTLQVFEVGLRNAIHAGLAFRCGTPAWYDSTSVTWRQSELEAIQAAKDELTKSHKPIEPGRIVAELRFGFWAGLLNTTYDRTWPSIIARVFPFMPRRQRTRQNAQRRVQSIRKLRNRVFHHERITHMPLMQLHGELLEAVQWVCPTLLDLIRPIDRFPEIFRRGPDEMRRILLKEPYPPDYSI